MEMPVQIFGSTLLQINNALSNSDLYMSNTDSTPVVAEILLEIIVLVAVTSEGLWLNLPAILSDSISLIELCELTYEDSVHIRECS